MDASDRRSVNRKKRRIPCHLWVGKRVHNALVLDLSPTGLFIQTHAKTNRGDRLDLRLPGIDNAMLDLVVEVVRVRQVPQALLAAAKGGIGVRIVNAPEEYFQLWDETGQAERSAGEFELEEPAPATGSQFQVYVAQTSGPRSRRLMITAPDPDAAGSCALEAMGEGWKVLRVEPA
jgi:hypothetical protein